MEAIEIVESRRKILCYLGGALAFVAAAVFLPEDDNHGLLWAGGFFGICALLFFVLLFRPRRLTVNGSGFSISGGLVRRPVTIRWKDVTGFYPVQIRIGTSMVGFDYSADAANKPRGAALAHSISGAEGGIIGAWPCSTSDLADLLNHHREQALKTAS